MSTFDKFEEYKFLVEDTARMTDRRQNTSTIYLTINTTLLAGILVILESITSGGLLALILLAALFLSAALLNTAWRNMIENYKKLLRVRFDILYEIENHPALAESARVYHREAEELYPRDEDGKQIDQKGLFSNLEKLLPTLFIGLYLLLTAAVIVYALIIWI